MTSAPPPRPLHRTLALSGPGGPVELSVAEWPGPDDLPPLVCIPGFTRNSRDFEELARSLAGRRRLICPDLVGRGESSRLADARGYIMATYLAHLHALCQTFGRREVSVLGVSMGGLLAMALAADPALRVRELVVVDVGPSVPATALDLLDLYLQTEHRFADFDALLAHVKRYFAACALDSELAWRWFALRGARKRDDGSYVPDYDPAIRTAFRADLRGMAAAWPVYDRITARTLVLRGEQSHVLPADVAAEMTRRGPRATLALFAGTGHWPALVKPGETATVAAFLDGR